MNHSSFRSALKRLISNNGAILANHVDKSSQKANIRQLASFTPSNKRNIRIIGSLSNYGQPKAGVEKGPDSLRSCGLIADLQNLGYNVQDHGDVVSEKVEEAKDSKVINANNVSNFNFLLHKAVKEIVKKDSTCITLGGDHSIAIGSIQGHYHGLKKRIKVIWIDAHADINTHLTTETGNMHGMPLSFLIRELKNEHPVLPGWEWVEPILSAQDIVFIGLRDVDPPERDIIERHNIRAYSMREVDSMGMASVIKESLDYLKLDDGSLHVSFDVDGLDILEAPSTGTPVPGGLTLREAQCLMEAIHLRKHPTVVDIVEVNPTIGTVEDVRKTCLAAKFTMLSLFGRYRGGGTV